MGDKVLVYVHDTGAAGHALAEGYADSQHTIKPVYVTGAPGIEEYTKKGKAGWIKTVPGLRGLKGDDLSLVVDFCKEKNIGLVDIRAEDPLSQGLADRLINAGIPVIGPTQDYTRIESDRFFTDGILEKIGVKPEYRMFRIKANSSQNRRREIAEAANRYVRDMGYQVVVKAAGLAQGKGSSVCNNPRDAEKAIERIIVNQEFKAYAPNSLNVIIEARQHGTEISFFAYLDGETFLPLKMFVQDYKAAFDPDNHLGMFYFNYGRDSSGMRRFLHENRIRTPKNLEKMAEEEKAKLIVSQIKERGINLVNPNTGGTGSYCPHRLVEEDWVVNKIIGEAVRPFVDEIYNLGWKYKGILYFGGVITPDIKVLIYEVNIRKGDPEEQVMIRKQKTDQIEIAWAVWEGKLDELKRNLPNREVEWNNRHYVDVVAMSGPARYEGGYRPGYPGGYQDGHVIEGLDTIPEDIAVFITGTEWKNGKLVTKGGRNLHLVGGGNTLEGATDMAYKAIENHLAFINPFNGENCLRYRKQIGAREILH